MRTLLIDNHDSFTFNLHQLLWEATGAEPAVVRNDEARWEELERLGFEAVVLSPGPGRPERERDFGVCAEAIRRCRRPLLGVCLGMQGIGWLNGGEVVRAPRPLHGHLAAVEHRGSPLFAGIPSRFRAVRYHSLCLSRPLPDSLEEIARGDDGVPMAIAHRSRPQWGVQFHPESIATEHGRRLIENFVEIARRAKGAVPRSPSPDPGAVVEFHARGDGNSTSNPPGGRPRDAPPRGGRQCLRLATRRLDAAPDPERLFVALYGASRNAFWLDSSSPGPRARFSFMGDDGGPLAALARRDAGAAFEFLEAALAGPPPRADAELPFEFDCGPVGYLGYELRAECGGTARRSPHPDLALLLADRVVALDHERGDAYLLCLHEPGGEGDARAWLRATAARVEEIAAAHPAGAAPGAGSAEAGSEASAAAPGAGSVEAAAPLPPAAEPLRLARSRERYLADIERCQELLAAGESYEICLTNTLAAATDLDPLDLYRRLRRANPAPFSAYLRFGEVAVLSSSPERFLAVDRDRRAEARPIKGTARRDPDPAEDARLAAALAADPKSRAENLMIADLLRNDLGSVCEPGSVEVPELIAVESFETVHQLVTTVRGRLRPGVGAAGAARACFPPGSMTGAPKLRTTELIDAIEGAPRGVYSGAIGWFGLGGACDLSVAIRTIVMTPAPGADAPRAAGPLRAPRWRLEVGAGGAIVLGSEPEAEWEEMLLKAAAPLRALAPGLDPASISSPEQGPAVFTSSPSPVPDPTS